MKQPSFLKALHHLATLLQWRPMARSWSRMRATRRFYQWFAKLIPRSAAGWSLCGLPLITMTTLARGLPIHGALLSQPAASEPISLFLLEITLAIDFGILSLATLVLRINHSRRRRVVVGLAWLVWAGALFSLPYMVTNSPYGQSLMALFAILLPLIVFPIGMEGLFQVSRFAPQSMLRIILTLFANALLFFLPFFLWAPSGMERFWTATFFALLLGGLALYAEFSSFGRVPQGKPPAKKR